MTTIPAFRWLTILSLLVSGCSLFDTSEYINALPLEADMRIIMGESAASIYANAGGPIECPLCCVSENNEYIKGDLYKLTQEAANNVIKPLVATFTWIKIVINLPFSRRIENTDGFLWGPWDGKKMNDTSDLEYRFKMTKGTEKGSFDLLGETKHKDDDAKAFETFMTGNTQTTDRPNRVTGRIEVDFKVLQRLDGEGSTKLRGLVVFDFDVRQENPSLQNPNKVTVTFTDFYEEPPLHQDPGPLINTSYYYERYDNLSGKLQFDMQSDIAGPDGGLDDEVDEMLTVESRWTPDGDGLGIASVTNGSLSNKNVANQVLTECWSDDLNGYLETYDHRESRYSDATPPKKEVHCGDEAGCPSF